MLACLALMIIKYGSRVEEQSRERSSGIVGIEKGLSGHLDKSRPTLSLSLSLSLSHTHTHTHTHIYIYIYIYIHFWLERI